jgi:glutathione S-transferase
VSLILYAHPFSSYCQKVLIALYENATPFEFRMLSPDNRTVGAEFVKLWPLRRCRYCAMASRT